MSGLKSHAQRAFVGIILMKLGIHIKTKRALNLKADCARSMLSPRAIRTHKTLYPGRAYSFTGVDEIPERDSRGDQ
jgi:hypothetical protein